MTMHSDVKTILSEAEVYESMGLYAEALNAYEKALLTDESLKSEVIENINHHIDQLKKKLADESLEASEESEFSRETLDQIKAHAPDKNDIAPILDRAGVFFEKGLYEEAADEYAMLFSIGYSFATVIPSIIDFLMTVCSYGQVGKEALRIIEKFDFQKVELAEITALFGMEIGNRYQYCSAAGLFEKAKSLDPGNKNIEKMYAVLMEKFLNEPRSVFLTRRTRLTTEHLKKGLILSFNEEKSFLSALVDKDYIEKGRLMKALSDYHKCPVVVFDPKLEPPQRLVSKLEKEVLLSQGWVPLEWNHTGASVVVENPEDSYQAEQIKSVLSIDDVQFCVGVQADIELLIEHFFEKGEKLEKIEAQKAPRDGESGIVTDIVEMLERKNGWNNDQKISVKAQLISAEVKLKEENGQPISLLVGLKDSPDQGIGLLISSKDYRRLNQIKEGEVIDDIIFYTGWAMIRTKSVVRNVTRLKGGKNKGQYLVEVESTDIA